jgi:hypothetical protein
MPIPESFTPAALSAGVATDIASDILEHHVQALEGTLVGRMLKSAGLIEPDFDDRLREALSQALNLYFEACPQYQLSGITAFFRDPAVARQLGGYILDWNPIDQDEIQHALDRHLGRHSTTAILITARAGASTHYPRLSRMLSPGFERATQCAADVHSAGDRRPDRYSYR